MFLVGSSYVPRGERGYTSSCTGQPCLEHQLEVSWCTVWRASQHAAATGRVRIYLRSEERSVLMQIRM